MTRRRLRDYYRQFEELSPEEVTQGYKERSAAARAQALSIVPPLDLTSTAWHEPPHPDIVNVATFALRRAVNAYPDPAAALPRAALAERHGLDADRVVLGHGAGELLGAALAAVARGGEVALPWPTWAPLPALVRQGGGEPVAVPLHDDAIDLGAIDAAIHTTTRAIVLASPNDPTGVPLGLDALDGFLRTLPERVIVLVDEACVEFLDDDASALAMLDAHPRLIVVRSFAKAHAMAGFRVGWAAGGEGARELLGAMTPSGAVGAAAQAAVIAAVEVADRVLPRHREAAAAARSRLAAALEGTGVRFPRDAAANFAWLEADGHDSREIAAHLAAARVFVTPGAAYGDERRVRAALRGPGAVDRLAAALRELG